MTEKSTIEKFRERFKDGLPTMKIHNAGHSSWIEHPKLESFILEVEKNAFEKGKKESHKTENGYCCACEYDIAVFESKLKEAFEKGKDYGRNQGLSVIGNIISKKDSTEPQFVSSKKIREIEDFIRNPHFDPKEAKTLLK